jgi:Family of unknown function (DUF6166)
VKSFTNMPCPCGGFAKHSPSGFGWGRYGARGAVQLALALLADCLEDDAQALRLYLSFKRKMVAGFPFDS